MAGTASDFGLACGPELAASWDARLPLDGILVETDAPWLAPMPDRGKRNEPAWVTRTAHVLAGLHGVSDEEIASATTKNFFRLFRLPPDVGN